MSHSFVSLVCHIIFSTKNRRPMLKAEIRSELCTEDKNQYLSMVEKKIYDPVQVCLPGWVCRLLGEPLADSES
jgi:hypothetical protein